MRPLPSELTVEDMLQGVSGIGTVAPPDSSEARRLCRTISRGKAHLILKAVSASARRGYRGRGRTAADVSQIYQASYGTPAVHAVDGYGRRQRRLLFRLGDRAIAEAEPRHVMRFVTGRLGEIIAACEP